MIEDNLLLSRPLLNQSYLSQNYEDKSNIFEKITKVFLGSVVNNIKLPDFSVTEVHSTIDDLLEIANDNSPIIATVIFGYLLCFKRLKENLIHFSPL